MIQRDGSARAHRGVAAETGHYAQRVRLVTDKVRKDADMKLVKVLTSAMWGLAFMLTALPSCGIGSWSSASESGTFCHGDGP
jgi:hypothetical protein